MIGDCVGKKIGKLKILKEFVEEGRTLCECKCECGNSATVRKHNLLNGSTKSCGCLQKEHTLLDLKGKRFGRLIGVKRLEFNAKTKSFYWLFKCDCGRMTKKLGSVVKSGNTSSCGCILENQEKENIKKALAVKSKYEVEGTNLLTLQGKLLSTNTSGYKGVSKIKRKGVWKGKWQAQITFKRKHYNLGTFDNIDDAIKARKDAEDKFFQPILDKYEEK